MTKEMVPYEVLIRDALAGETPKERYENLVLMKTNGVSSSPNGGNPTAKAAPLMQPAAVMAVALYPPQPAAPGRNPTHSTPCLKGTDHA